MIHYVDIGYFEREGDFIRFARLPEGPGWRIVLRQPLDLRVVEQILQEMGCPFVTLKSIPGSWGVLWHPDGYLVCDKYTRHHAVIELAARVAERTGCDIADRNTLSLLSPKALRQTWAQQDEAVRAYKTGHSTQ